MASAKELDEAVTNLESPTLKVRRKAISYLRFEDTFTKPQRNRAILALIKTLGDRTPTIRTAAAAALAYHPDERAVEPLIELLKDKSRDVRQYAAQTLGAIGDPRAVEPLTELEDSPVVIRAIASCMKKKRKR